MTPLEAILWELEQATFNCAIAQREGVKYLDKVRKDNVAFTVEKIEALYMKDIEITSKTIIENEMVRLKNAGGAKGYGSHLIIDYADGRIAELTKLKGEK